MVWFHILLIHIGYHLWYYMWYHSLLDWSERWAFWDHCAVLQGLQTWCCYNQWSATASGGLQKMLFRYASRTVLYWMCSASCMLCKAAQCTPSWQIVHTLYWFWAVETQWFQTCSVVCAADDVQCCCMTQILTLTDKRARSLPAGSCYQIAGCYRNLCWSNEKVLESKLRQAVHILSDTVWGLRVEKPWQLALVFKYFQQCIWPKHFCDIAWRLSSCNCYNPCARPAHVA